MGRTYEEGKKIKPSDGLKAVVTLLRFRSWRGAAPALTPIAKHDADEALQVIKRRLAYQRS
jgi:hypothetical protein